MKGLLTTVFAATISTAVVATSFVPAEAGPAFVPAAPAVTSDVLNVEYVAPANRDYYVGGPVQVLPGARQVLPKSYRRANNLYYNGYRGYREYRPGYRRYNDAWYPAAAFITGAIIGGALSNGVVTERRVVRRSSGNAHVEWCYDRYRSYRASDNTFQPYHGPRQQCYSPYD
jgi:hypothetical protein